MEHVLFVIFSLMANHLVLSITKWTIYEIIFFSRLSASSPLFKVAGVCTQGFLSESDYS